MAVSAVSACEREARKRYFYIKRNVHTQEIIKGTISSIQLNKRSSEREVLRIMNLDPKCFKSDQRNIKMLLNIRKLQRLCARHSACVKTMYFVEKLVFVCFRYCTCQSQLCSSDSPSPSFSRLPARINSGAVTHAIVQADCEHRFTNSLSDGTSNAERQHIT